MEKIMRSTLTLHSVQKSKIFFILFSILFMISTALQISAQPSGGPYGPILQKYDLPKIKGKIYYVAPDGKTDVTGETVSKPTTIESAIEKVKTGDAIVMRGGTYRTGKLILNQGITIQPYEDEQPVLKGTYVADNWENLGNGLWTTKWPRLFPSKPQDWWRRNREGKYTPPYRFNNDMVFVDGKFLQAVGWEGEVNENTYYIDYDSGTIYIGVDPANKLVEITAFDAAIIRTTRDVHDKSSDKIGMTIRGITFTQYAYRAIEIEGNDPEGISPESEHGKEVVGSIFENCTISFCSRVAGYFRGDHFKMIHCKISDTSTEGVYLIGSSDALLEGNIFTRNNIERITGYYPAAVKIFNQCYRVTCKDNLVIDLPYSNGIWYDVGNVDGCFINNWVEGVGNINNPFSIEQPWPSDNGFFFEISKGAICAGNVFVNCDHGIWVLNSSNVHIYNNTFVNSTACISRNARSAANDHFGWHPSTGPDVDKRNGHVFENNLLTGDENFMRPLLYVWQPASICDKIKDSQLDELDFNMFVRSNSSDYPLIWWSPVQNEKCIISFNSLEGLQKLHPEFASHSKYFPDYTGPLFKCTELGNYELLQAFPGSESGTKLPIDVVKILGQTKQFVGAYPPIK
jgi:parallel beta-helix repeat protein